jgi:PAS domain S-box-containing protein
MQIRSQLSGEELKKYISEITPLKKGFDLLADHVVITDENAAILYANKAAEKATGFSAEEMLGKNPGDLWGGNMPDDFYKEMWKTIKEDKKPFVGEVLNKRKDGKEYWQEMHISPMLDEAGNVKFFIAVEPNINDRKRRQEFRGEFISELSEQIRDPLAVIQWTLRWLAERGELNEEQRKTLEKMYKERQGLANLVGDLLMLANLEKEK